MTDYTMHALYPNMIELKLPAIVYVLLFIDGTDDIYPKIEESGTTTYYVEIDGKWKLNMLRVKKKIQTEISKVSVPQNHR